MLVVVAPIAHHQDVLAEHPKHPAHQSVTVRSVKTIKKLKIGKVRDVDVVKKEGNFS